MDKQVAVVIGRVVKVIVMGIGSLTLSNQQVRASKSSQTTDSPKEIHLVPLPIPCM